MDIRLIAAGTRLPSWANEGYLEYAKRFGREFTLELLEIPLGRTDNAIRQEGERMQAAISKNDYVVTLQVGGKPLSTEALADFLLARLRDAKPLTFCIGGPEGIAKAVDDRANFRWSLSPLTLPHALVRVVVAEALYRAVSVIQGHPYHRASANQ
jgi:23S rRNA (pseudouridine1915-N3)-methyltransferase